MKKTRSFNYALLATAAGLGAVFSLSPPANAKDKSIKASEDTVKSKCQGTFLGSKESGQYGCISRDQKSVTLCKKGKCDKYAF